MMHPISPVWKRKRPAEEEWTDPREADPKTEDPHPREADLRAADRKAARK